MKIIASLCCLLLLPGGFQTGVRGESFRTDINPAQLYYQSFLLEPKLKDADHDYLFTNQWQGRVLPERFGALLDYYHNDLLLWHRAAAQKVPCDWGVDLTTGADALLPHLSHCKQASLMMALDVQWRLQQGDQAGARDDVLASLTLGRNAARDDTLIGALVQGAIQGIVCWNVAENFGQFSPRTLQQLATGFDAAPAWGTVATAMAGEKILFHDWMISVIQDAQKANPNDETAVMAALGQEIGRRWTEETNFWPQLTNATGGTSEGLLKMVRDTKPWFKQLDGIMALPHGAFEAQFSQLRGAVKQSGNYLFADGLNAWNDCRRKEFTRQVELAMVRAAMEYKLHGEAGLKSIMDPCGNGPFACKRFVFQDEDCGFQLTSTYVSHSTGRPVTLIFVEKDGAPFLVGGTHPGEAIKP
jgi:hypothetical protein